MASTLDTLSIPATQRPARALLVVLHGLGDSVHGWDWLPGDLGLPWMEYLLVNAPDPYYGGYSWYDIHGDQGVGIRRSRGLLLGLLEDLVARGRDPRTIGLLGFSQGCLMTFDAGLRLKAPLGALVGISGYVHEPSALVGELGPEARSVPALFTHGTRDPIVPMLPVRGQVEQLKSAGLDLTWREFEKVHTVAGEPEVAVIREFLVRHLGRLG